MNKFAAIMGGVFIFSLLSSAWARGEFTKSCWNVDLNNNTFLTADCRTRSGATANTGIQLNNRIANDDGRLVWRRNGNFGASSRNCDVDNQSGRTFLHCDTQRRNGSWTSSSFNVDDHSANINGNLRYEQ